MMLNYANEDNLFLCNKTTPIKTIKIQNKS